MSAGNKQSNPFSDISFCLLAAVILLVPLTFTTAIENGFTLAKAAALGLLGGLFIIAAAIVLLKRIIRRNDDTGVIVTEKKTDRAVLFFLTAAAVSTIFSIRPQISLFGQLERQIGLLLFVDLALIYFFSSQILDSRNKIRTLFLVMEIAGIIVSLYGFTQFLMIDPFGLKINHMRPVSTIGHGIFLAGFLIMVYPAALVSALEKSKPYLRFLSPIIITFGIVAAQSRIVYIAWILVTCLVLVLYKHISQEFNRRKFIIRLLIILLAFAAGIMLITTVFPENVYVKRFYSILNFFESSRYLLWRNAFKVFAMYPFTGSGIETFSYAFENIISPQLRLMEVDRFFDNAHSNFIQALCTMGIVGFISYLVLILVPIGISMKMVLSGRTDKQSRMLSLILLGSFAGYFIYGIADFDNNVILLYFFVLAASLKSLYVREYRKQTFLSGSYKISYKTISVVVAAAVVCFAGFNMYKLYYGMIADSYFQTGRKYYTEGNFRASVDALNKSVVANPLCPDYKFTLANNVFDFASNNADLTFESKQKLLKQAEEELGRAEVNYPLVLQCKALRAMIYLEQGRELESQQLVSDVFKLDPYMIPLRNNLAAFYLRKQNIPKMKQQLGLIEIYDPLNVTAARTSLDYCLQISDTAGAILSCEKILKLEPDNAKAKLKLAELRNKKE